MRRPNHEDTASERPRYPPRFSWWSPLVAKLVQKEDLTFKEIEDATLRILKLIEKRDPNAPVVMASFFGGLSTKGPTVEELAAMNSAMEKTKRARFNFLVKKPIVTAGGTGGDTLKTINVTTPAVLLASAAGAVAVKSGAKAFSSKTGATDLALTMGINVNAKPQIVKMCVERTGTAVWSSSAVYPWMNPLVELRNSASAPVFFPLMGSLRLMIATSLNPFSTKRQVRGISTPQTQLVVDVFSKVGYDRALVPLGYGDDESIRIDEFSNLGKTVVSELFSNGKIETYQVGHEDLGVRRGDPNEIVARETHRDNAKVALNILSGRDHSSRRDLITINAAAILYLADEAGSIKEGHELASNAIDEGKAIIKVKELVGCSRGDPKRLAKLLA
jgi:anthranilate phosphoribosyltransferase